MTHCETETMSKRIPLTNLAVLTIIIAVIAIAANHGDGNGSDPLIDPDSTDAVQVPQASARVPDSERVRAAMWTAVRMPIEERPEFFRAVLADPSLTAAERSRLTSVFELFSRTQPMGVD